MTKSASPAIELIPQESQKGCGQACIAMLAGTTFGEAVSIVGRDSATTTKDLVRALKKFGVLSNSRLVRLHNRQALPDACVVMLRPDGGGLGHWVVHYKGLIYDPEEDEPAAVQDYFPAGYHPTSYLAVEIMTIMAFRSRRFRLLGPYRLKYVGAHTWRLLKRRLKVVNGQLTFRYNVISTVKARTLVTARRRGMFYLINGSPKKEPKNSGVW